MSVLTEPLAQLKTEVDAMESRVNQKVADAEKKSVDAPTAEEVAELTQLTEKIKGLFTS